ncbi:MAG: hypothetical protein ABIL78_00345 [candidate division WOR-3 bacterium]
MRRNVFVGAHAFRERRAFREFLKKHFPDKLRIIDEKISEMVFNDEKNVRTSKILQTIFLEVYEFYVKGNENMEKALVEALRIRYDKNFLDPSQVLSELIERLKDKKRE